MPPGPDEDALAEQLLVLRAQLGARDAIASLVDRHDERLLFYLRRLLGSRTDGDDLRQEVWLTVVRKLGTLEDPGAFRAWLYQVARNHAISWLRKRRIEVPVDDVVVAASDPDDADDELRAEDAAAAVAALDTLSRSHREMLTLRYLSGLSYQEIARVVGCPIGTVRSRIHYAREALRQAMKAKGGQGP